MRLFRQIVVGLAIAPVVPFARAQVVPAAVAEFCRAQPGATQPACTQCAIRQQRALRSCERACFKRYPEVLRGSTELDALLDGASATAREDCLDACRATLEARISRRLSPAPRKAGSSGKSAAAR